MWSASADEPLLREKSSFLLVEDGVVLPSTPHGDWKFPLGFRLLFYLTQTPRPLSLSFVSMDSTTPAPAGSINQSTPEHSHRRPGRFPLLRSSKNNGNARASIINNTPHATSFGVLARPAAGAAGGRLASGVSIKTSIHMALHSHLQGPDRAASVACGGRAASPPAAARHMGLAARARRPGQAATSTRTELGSTCDPCICWASESNCQPDAASFGQSASRPRP